MTASAMRWLLAPVLGAWVALMAVATYHVLEWVLADYADYDRGVWEGAAIICVMNGCMKLAHLVLKRGQRDP
jgi:hypothetical protein